jgi:hypothetical protein
MSREEVIMNRKRPRDWPSPALVVSSFALLVSLTGTGYAVGVLPGDSVGTAQLRNDAVVSSKVKTARCAPATSGRVSFQPARGKAGFGIIAGSECSGAGAAGTFQVNTYVSSLGVISAGDAAFTLLVP